MIDLLIPFGISSDTDKIVEPEDALKGRACNCLCPGCGAHLLSRHPKEKRWHFAHDSRHEKAKPKEDCPFNSALAVAMMARSVANKLIGKIIETPSHETWAHYDCCGHSELLQVRPESTNRISHAEARVTYSGHKADLKLLIGDYPLLIDLVYAGKDSMMIDESILNSAKAGVLELYCDSFSADTLRKDRKARFSDLVVSFILKEGFRDWRFHPKTEHMLKNAKHSHVCEKRKPGQLTTVSKRNDKSAYSRPSLGKQSIETSYQPPQVRGIFTCKMCQHTWSGIASNNNCEKCKTHLYSVFCAENNS